VPGMPCARCRWRSFSFGCAEAFCLLRGRPVGEFDLACPDFHKADEAPCGLAGEGFMKEGLGGMTVEAKVRREGAC